MMTGREIGGYFEFERFSGEVYHPDAIALNSGRSCLEYLIRLRGIQVIWLPNWLCESVPRVCSKCGVRIETYRVGMDMRPIYDFDVSADAYLYIVDYFGQLDAADIEQARARCAGRLIVDEAQCFFRPPWEKTDTLYTCRKFFGVADGGYLYTKDGALLAEELDKGESYDHMQFVLGRYERSAREFYQESKANNKRFIAEGMKGMSALTDNLMHGIDYDEARSRRERNFGYLHERFGAINRIDLCMSAGPYAYPLYIGEISGVREALAERSIFVASLWPTAIGREDRTSAAYLYSDHMLPLPIDQRYGVDEMEIVADALSECLAVKDGIR